MIRLAEARAVLPTAGAAIRFPFSAFRLIAALHGVDQAAEHALVPSDLHRRPSDVADVAPATGSEQRQADQRREGGPAVRIGKAGDLLWPPDADRPTEYALHIISDILELRPAP